MKRDAVLASRLCTTKPRPVTWSGAGLRGERASERERERESSAGDPRKLHGGGQSFGGPEVDPIK